MRTYPVEKRIEGGAALNGNGAAGFSAAAKYDDHNIKKDLGKFPIKKAAAMVVGVVLAIGAGMWLREWWTTGRFIETTDDAFVEADITTVSSKVPGFVVKIAVSDNEAVRAGDLLVVIEDRDYRARLAKAAATVDAQEAMLSRLDASAALQEAVISQARAKTQASRAEEARAKADQTRAKGLVGRRVISEQDFEQYDATAEKADAEDEAAAAALVAAERQLDVIRSQRREAEAALAQARASEDLAKLDLGYTEIRSPIDGVVGSKHVQIGDYATTGEQLMSVVPSSGLYVDANFKESQIAEMRPGQVASIEADVLKGVVFHGRVQSLAPATGAQFSLLPAENATGNFTKIVQRVPIRIRLEGEAAELGKLRPGLSVVARVDVR